MPETHKVFVDHHLKGTKRIRLGRDKSFQVTMTGMPATVQLTDAGAVDGAPVVDSRAKDHALEQLAHPIASLLEKYKETSDLPLPRIRIEFRDTEVEETDQDAAADDSEAELDDIRYPIANPTSELSQLVLPAPTKSDLEIVLNLVRNHRLMYDAWNLNAIPGSDSSLTSLNFYGASGTGKTLAADAVAAHLGKKILRVNYSELESKYVGEMNKNICKVFARARVNDCVLFFDEADSILGKRLTSVSQAADHGINMARSVMLIEMERFSGVVIFASNFVRNYDQAFERRILHSVQFHLPDEECREQIFQIHMPKELPIAEDVSPSKLALLTDGFSGGDIRKLVFLAAARAASQSGPDHDKVLTMEHFSGAVKQTKDAREAMRGVPQTSGQKWMETKVDGMLDRQVVGDGPADKPR